MAGATAVADVPISVPTTLAATLPATTRPAVIKIKEPADQPAIKLGKNGLPDAGFLRMHQSFLKRGKQGNIGLLFVGDSITDFWRGHGKAVWEKTYTPYDPANFGISGDRTQHLLWRIHHGELDGINPKVLVLMIGTNNIGYPAADIVKGDEKIVAEIHHKLPQTKLLLLGIFPRGRDPQDPDTIKNREKIKQVNDELARLDDGSKTRYLDLSNKFLAPDGTLPRDIMPDGLHPSAKGYQIWADAMQPLLDEMWK
jgi:lysophospholipase L1-like esterase